MQGEWLYRQAPVCVQNAAVSVYGLGLQIRRYGGASSRYAQDLASHERWPADRVNGLQLEMLRQRALTALEHVPAYAALSRHAAAVRHARTPEEILDLFPILTKADIRRNPRAFVPRNLRSRLLVGATSGTTGTPLRLYRTVDGIRKNFAFFRRVRRWHGVALESRTATLMGRLAVPARQSAPPFWRYSRFTRNLLLSSYHLSERTGGLYAAAVAEFRPQQIVCYPSSGAALARFVLDHGTALQGVRAVFTTAETLLDTQRQMMKDAFGCGVADQYGSSEWTVWISECEAGTYHIHPEYGFLEVLDGENRRLRHGVGRAITTGFVNDAMILIRYDSGDHVDLNAPSGESTCPCGRHFASVSRIEGRMDDVIRTPSGRIVGRLDPVFKGLDGICEAQLVQTSPNELVARLVTVTAWTDVYAQRLVRQIRERTGNELDVRIELVPSIARSAGGKFRSVLGFNSTDARAEFQAPPRA